MSSCPVRRWTDGSVSRARRMTAGRMAAAALLALLAGCREETPSTTSSAPPPPAAGTSRGQVGAYVDVTLTDVPGPPAGLTLLLAFVTAGPDGCTPTWGGVLPLDDPAVLARVRQWRRGGHELRVSFGGELGTDLAEGCADERQLAAAYRQVVATLS